MSPAQGRSREGYRTPPGASAAQFSDRWFGGPTRSVVSVPTVGTSVVILLKNNPTRVGVTLTNNTSNTVLMLPSAASQAPTSTLGIPINPNGGSVVMNVESDGEKVAWEWQALSNTGSNQITVIEDIQD